MVCLGEVYGSNYIVDSYAYMLRDNTYELKLQAEEVVDADWVSMKDMKSKKNKDRMIDWVWDRYCLFEDKIRDLK